MAHEIRTDLAMWLGSLFLLVKGGGGWSLDKKINGRNAKIIGHGNEQKG